jgi:hypothetical protein
MGAYLTGVVSAVGVYCPWLSEPVSRASQSQERPAPSGQRPKRQRAGLA